MRSGLLGPEKNWDAVAFLPTATSVWQDLLATFKAAGWTNSFQTINEVPSSLRGVLDGDQETIIWLFVFLNFNINPGV